MERKLIFRILIMFFIFLILSSVSADSVLKGDINKDEKIDKLDLENIDAAFHSTPEDENWNPDADVVTDNQIDVFDLATVGKGVENEEELELNDDFATSEIITKDGEKFVIRDDKIYALVSDGYYIKFDPSLPSTVCEDERIDITVKGKARLSLDDSNLVKCHWDKEIYVYYDLYIMEKDSITKDDEVRFVSRWGRSYDCESLYFEYTFEDVDLSYWIIPDPGENGEFYTKAVGDFEGQEIVDISSISYDISVDYNCNCIGGRCCDLSSRPYDYKEYGEQPSDRDDYYYCSGEEGPTDLSFVMYRDYYCLGDSFMAYDYLDSIEDSCELCEYCEAGYSNCFFYCDYEKCGIKDCDYLDTFCRDYHDVDRRCTGGGICSNPSCNSYTNSPAGTPCGTNKECDGNGECKTICESHDYFSCYDNDVYWYDSCNNREEKKQECGQDSCESWSNDYCYDGDVYHLRECHDRGCSNDKCFDNMNIEREKLQECGTSGYVGSNYCYDNDVYRDYANKGCSGGNCYANVEKKKQQECGANGCENGKCISIPEQCDGTDISCGTWPNCENCDDKDGCSGNYYRNYYCKSNSEGCKYFSDNCNDCSCSCGGYGVDESNANENCNDGKDNDCDGKTDGDDSGCVAVVCTQDSDCSAGKFCKFERGQCGGIGTCYEKPLTCPTIMDTVCGCDYVTYENECSAFMQGVSILKSGKCIVCEEDSDCGGEDWMGEPICQYDDVFQKRGGSRCKNPGTIDSFCQNYITSLLLKEDCGEDRWEEDTAYCYDNDVYGLYLDVYCEDGQCKWNALEKKYQECGDLGCENKRCIVCRENSDCGEDGWVGEPSCQSNNVFQTWRTYECKNPGTLMVSCVHTDTNKLKQDCGNNYCEDFGENYCKGNDVYTKRDCYDKGCSNAECFSNLFEEEKLVKECEQVCLDGYCGKIVDLFKGVNLFSLPMVPETPKTFNELISNCDVVNNGMNSECDGANLAYLNPSTGNYECLDLDDILYPGQGYFIKVKDDCAFVVAGKDLTTEYLGYIGTGIIKKGENLIGSLTKSMRFSNIKGNCQIKGEPLVFVYGVDNCEGVSYYTGTSYCGGSFCYCSVSTLVPGLGYNVYSEGQCRLY